MKVARDIIREKPTVKRSTESGALMAELHLRVAAKTKTRVEQLARIRSTTQAKIVEALVAGYEPMPLVDGAASIGLLETLAASELHACLKMIRTRLEAGENVGEIERTLSAALASLGGSLSDSTDAYEAEMAETIEW